MDGTDITESPKFISQAPATDRRAHSDWTAPQIDNNYPSYLMGNIFKDKEIGMSVFRWKQRRNDKGGGVGELWPEGRWPRVAGVTRTATARRCCSLYPRMAPPASTILPFLTRSHCLSCALPSRLSDPRSYFLLACPSCSLTRTLTFEINNNLHIYVHVSAPKISSSLCLLLVDPSSSLLDGL